MVDSGPASIWVLNTIHELDVASPAPTHDELHRDRLRRGLVEPTVIGGADLDARTTVVRQSGSDCLASYGFVPAGMDEDVDRCFTGPVMRLVDLVGGSRLGTPSNVWAVDRSWMLWTDGDLCATKVNGPHSLIADLEADPDLETTAWP